MGLVLPGSTKIFIDDVVAHSDTVLLWKLLWVVGLAITIQAVTSFALTRLLAVEAHRLIAELRTEVQAHVIHLPVSYFDDTKSGVLVSRIMSDVEGVRNLVGTGLVQLVGGLLTAIAAFVILLRLNAQMTLVAIVPLVIFSGVSAYAFKAIRPIFRERGKIRADVTGRLTESLGGVRVIKGFHAEESEKRIFVDGAMRLFRNVARSLTATSLVTASATLLMGVASILIMGLGGRLIMAGEMTVGDFFAFTMYLAFLVSPIAQIAGIGTQLTESMAGLDRTEEVLRELRESDDASRTVSIGPVDGRIVFDDVSFAYEAEREVLQDISFEAPPGTVTALVGSSGSGKTTMAGLAASFLVPTRGRVTVDGVDLATIDLGSYRRQLAVVLQDDFLFEGTIRENISFGRPGAPGDEVIAAAEAAYVNDFATDFDEGLDTVIGERGVKLSGGQRQRVAIARAVLADPRVLILDEATSNLDTESERYIQESLEQLMRGRTVFVIAHRLSTIRRADQILVIEDGSIVERGTHEALIAAGGRYHRLYTFQARI